MGSIDESMDTGTGSTSDPLVSQFNVFGLQSGSSGPSNPQTIQLERQPLAEIIEDAEVSSPVRKPKRKERGTFLSIDISVHRSFLCSRADVRRFRF